MAERDLHNPNVTEHVVATNPGHFPRRSWRAPRLSNSARVVAAGAEIRPEPSQFWPFRAVSDQSPPNWPIWVICLPFSDQLGQPLAQIGQFRTNLARSWANLAHSGRVWSKLSRCRRNVPCCFQHVAQVGDISPPGASFEQLLANIAQTLAKLNQIGPIWADIGQHL